MSSTQPLPLEAVFIRSLQFHSVIRPAHCAPGRRFGTGRPCFEQDVGCSERSVTTRHHNRVALGAPSQSLGEDAHAECPRKTLRIMRSKEPGKRLCLTRSREKMDSALAGGFASYSGDASGGGAIHQSSVDAADVDRTGQRDVLESAKVSTPLSLDRSAANS
jgi:hypothetical protein